MARKRFVNYRRGDQIIANADLASHAYVTLAVSKKVRNIVIDKIQNSLFEVSVRDYLVRLLIERGLRR